MSEEQTNFKVTDRRLFNADGSPRELSLEEKAAAAKAAAPVASPSPAANAEPTPREAPSAASREQSATNERREVTPETEDEGEFPDAEDPASFANFLMSIASNAASSLGMIEHPVTRKRDVDLELGKHWIDVLGMLEAKTRNNLSAQEKQILEGLLADLRMQYVSLANATPPKTRTFTSGDITGGV